MDIAYVKNGEWGGPYLTDMADGIKVYSEAPPNPYVHGYGPKIPTRYKVLYKGYWRRVYSACFSNCSTEYICVKGVDTAVDIYLD